VLIEAVAFDLDGVLADRRMQGMATMEWARYLHDELGVALPTADPGVG
jgi:hypothetical protein